MILAERSGSRRDRALSMFARIHARRYIKAIDFWPVNRKYPYLLETWKVINSPRLFRLVTLKAHIATCNSEMRLVKL